MALIEIELTNCSKMAYFVLWNGLECVFLLKSSSTDFYKIQIIIL